MTKNDSAIVPRGLIALLPVDTSRLSRHFDGVPQKPSIEHSLTTCDQCGEQCWIGPAQALHRLGSGNPAVCYYCLAVVQKFGKGFGEIRTLDATADSKTRRTS